MDDKILGGRQALVYGAGGAIGSAVSSAFAAAGATVHLAGRRAEPLEKVADLIRRSGGRAETARVDATDEAAVDEFTDAVAAQHGGVDICFDLTSRDEVFGAKLVDMPLTDFERPVHKAVRTMFLTSRAAARHMIRQGGGVILCFGGYGDPMADLGGFQTAFGAMEALKNTLACELGPHRIRVLTLQTNGIPEAIGADTDAKTRDEITRFTEAQTMTGRAATLDEVGRVAVFAASPMARSMTATSLNITAGAEVG